MGERYRVIIGNQASGQLDRIYRYIERFSEQNAGTMLGRLLDAIDGLSHMPARFKVAGRSERHGVDVHAMVVDPYVIYYYMEGGVVVVTDVLHGAQAQPRRFD